MVATEFTPLPSLVGGALIGASAVLLMLFHGRIAGISGIASRLLPPFDGNDIAGRAAFILGLVVAAPLTGLVRPWPAPVIEAGFPTLVAAGLLVGFGTVLGNGCTSGDGVCGLSRRALRSWAATLIFMATAAAVVFVVRHIP